MKPHPSAPVDPPRDATKKFVYPGGARPLDGYTIKRGIGRGGFGEVYFATSDGGKEVALKLVRRNLEVELRGVQQCLNLKHPNLLALFDIRQDGQGDTWIVMEHIQGETLEAELSRFPQGLPEARARRWFDGLAEAVAYLHDHGLVHRDLKPGNVFCDGGSIGQGIVKLGDYGLSKFISVSRRSGQTESVGTVHYMAPEVGHGRYGKEIDIYALGIMLFELLSGSVPFEGESVGEVLIKHLTAPPDLSRIDPRYQPVIGACLEKDPARRPATVEALLALLPKVEPSAGDSLAEMDRPAPAAPRPRPRLHSTEAYRTPRHEEPRGWRALSRFDQVGLILACGAIGLALWIAGPRLFGASRGLLLTAGGTWAAWAWVALSVAAGSLGLVLWGRSRRGSASRQSDVVLAPPVEPARIPPPVPPVAMAGVVVARPPNALIVGTTREQGAEFVGSLLLGLLVASITSFGLLILQGAPPIAEQAVWFALTCTLATWLILGLGRLWSGRVGDEAWRRFLSMLAGMALGAVAWLLDAWLLVDLSGAWRARGLPISAENWLYDPLGQPQVLVHLGYFGVLFLAVAWWRQADPLRPARVSLASVLIVSAIAALVALVAPFPVRWGVYFACATSISVQLAAPWQRR